MLNLLTLLGAVSVNALVSLFSPAGKHARLSIVLYHRVPLEADELLNDLGNVQSFDKHIHYLSNHFNILPLYEATQRLQDNSLPSRAACITFDDGYADNAEVALPVLQKYGVSATFFIATGFINGDMMWNDKVIELVRRAPGQFLDLSEIGLGKHTIDSLEQRRSLLLSLIDKLKYLPFEERHAQVEQLCQRISVELPKNLMMTDDQVRQLYNAGMEIGGHTVAHPILSRLGYDAAYDEIAKGKQMLENIIQAPVRFFAYPNGKPGRDYLPEHVAMLKEIGFEAAVSTAWGAADNSVDIYQLPRFTPWDITQTRFVMHMIQNMLRTVEVVPCRIKKH